MLLWAVSTKRGPGGATVADRRGAFAFPLQGRYRDDSLLLSQRGLSLTFRFGDVPMRRFDLRMQLGADRRARGASLTAEVFCPEVPVYGPALIAIGLCNRDPILPASGTFITGRYRGPANRRPRGRAPGRASSCERPTAAAAGSAVARLAGAPLRADRHAAAHPAHGRRHRRRGVARLPQGDFTKVGARSHQSGEAQDPRRARASRAASGHT